MKNLARFSTGFSMTEYHVYIMASRSRRIYTGVTSNLTRRVLDHKSGATGGFTARYHMTRLAYCEPVPDIVSAIAREKQIKGWLRSRKVALIESANPEWADLAADWFDE